MIHSQIEYDNTGLRFLAYPIKDDRNEGNYQKWLSVEEWLKNE